MVVYLWTWSAFAAGGNGIRSGWNRETCLRLCGLASLVALIGGWAAEFVAAFGLLHWACGLFTDRPSPLNDALVHSGATLLKLAASIRKW